MVEFIKDEGDHTIYGYTTHSHIPQPNINQCTSLGKYLLTYVDFSPFQLNECVARKHKGKIDSLHET